MSMNACSRHNPNTKTRCKEDHGAEIPTFPLNAVALGSRSTAPEFGPYQDFFQTSAGKPAQSCRFFCSGSLNQAPYSRLQPDFPQQRDVPLLPPFLYFFSAWGMVEGRVLWKSGTIGCRENDEVTPKK